MPALDRRTLLTGLVAAGTCAMLDGPATAAGKKPFFARIGRPIGLQLYALGDEAGRDLDRTFAQVAEIGYRDIELPSLYGKDAKTIRAAADRAGLAISSLHLAVTTRGTAAGLSLTSPPEAIAAATGALGAKLAVLPIMQFPADFRPKPGENIQAAIGRSVAEAGPDLWKQTAALLNERAAALKPHGVALGYHNHNLEFAPLGATNGWEILVGETDPGLVHFELDIGWIATAGRDPVAELGKLKGRVRQLHVKDVAAGNAVNHALSMKPTEVGSGTLDWSRILPAAYKAGARHFYVEQEPPFTMPRIDAARRSHGFLAGLRA